MNRTRVVRISGGYALVWVPVRHVICVECGERFTRARVGGRPPCCCSPRCLANHRTPSKRARHAAAVARGGAA